MDSGVKGTCFENALPLLSGTTFKIVDLEKRETDFRLMSALGLKCGEKTCVCPAIVMPEPDRTLEVKINKQPCMSQKRTQKSVWCLYKALPIRSTNK